jgi:hypothetical protein
MSTVSPGRLEHSRWSPVRQRPLRSQRRQLHIEASSPGSVRQMVRYSRRFPEHPATILIGPQPFTVLQPSQFVFGKGSGFVFSRDAALSQRARAPASARVTRPSESTSIIAMAKISVSGTVAICSSGVRQLLTNLSSSTTLDRIGRSAAAHGIAATAVCVGWWFLGLCFVCSTNPARDKSRVREMDATFGIDFECSRGKNLHETDPFVDGRFVIG